MKTGKNDLLSSFDSAFRGFLYALKKERNLRIHFGIGVLVLLGSLFLNLVLAEFLILVLLVTLVLVTEIFNTLIEMIMDTFGKEYSIRVKRIKDMGAALVLLPASASLIVGYLLIAKNFPPAWRNAFGNISHSPWYITFIILVLIISSSITLKFTLRRGSLLTGGMPSIHSGISFSIWTIVSFYTFRENPMISLFVFILAFWVAQSRVIKKIHNMEEVIIGALSGILITIMIFQIFW